MLLFITSNVYADKLCIPFSTYPKAIQKEFARVGKKLDLDANNRTESSWGFLVNKGTEFELYTYQNVTLEELDLIDEVINNLHKQGKLK